MGHQNFIVIVTVIVIVIVGITVVIGSAVRRCADNEG